MKYKVHRSKSFTGTNLWSNKKNRVISYRQALNHIRKRSFSTIHRRKNNGNRNSSSRYQGYMQEKNKINKRIPDKCTLFSNRSKNRQLVKKWNQQATDRKSVKKKPNCEKLRFGFRKPASQRDISRDEAVKLLGEWNIRKGYQIIIVRPPDS